MSKAKPKKKSRKRSYAAFELDGAVYFVEGDSKGNIKKTAIDGKVVLKLLVKVLEEAIG